jgi:hypothetical protein
MLDWSVWGAEVWGRQRADLELGVSATQKLHLTEVGDLSILIFT